MRNKMATINKILRMEKLGDGVARVLVLLEDGDEEYTIYIGGKVETFHHNGVNRAFITKDRKEQDARDGN